MRLVRTTTLFLMLAAALPIGTAPAQASSVHPTGTPIVVIASEGGFMAPGYIKSGLPSIVAYANGAVLTRFDSARPELREMRLHVLTPSRLRALINSIAKAAVRPKGGWGFPGVADVPSTRVQIAMSGLKRDVSVYALSFTNGGNVSSAQVAARNALARSITALDTAAKAQRGFTWKPATYEAWAMPTLVQPSTVGMANPASVFCVSMGGTLTLIDTANGQSSDCTLSDGTKADEWTYFRATSPTLAQWPSAVKGPTTACTVVKSSAFLTAWQTTNPTGLWLLPTGQAAAMIFRPVLPGEHACKRG